MVVHCQMRPIIPMLLHLCFNFFIIIIWIRIFYCHSMINFFRKTCVHIRWVLPSQLSFFHTYEWKTELMSHDHIFKGLKSLNTTNSYLVMLYFIMLKKIISFQNKHLDRQIYICCNFDLVTNFWPKSCNLLTKFWLENTTFFKVKKHKFMHKKSSF